MNGVLQKSSNNTSHAGRDATQMRLWLRRTAFNKIHAIFKGFGILTAIITHNSGWVYNRCCFDGGIHKSYLPTCELHKMISCRKNDR